MLDNLAFFFIPAGVSLLTSFDLLAKHWVQLLGLIIITTAFVIVITGLSVQRLIKGKKNELTDK